MGPPDPGRGSQYQPQRGVRFGRFDPPGRGSSRCTGAARSSGSTSRRNPRAPGSPPACSGARRRPARTCGGRACAAWGCSTAGTRPRRPGSPCAEQVRRHAATVARGDPAWRTTKRRRTTTGGVVRRREERAQTGETELARTRSCTRPQTPANPTTGASGVWTGLPVGAGRASGPLSMGAGVPIAGPARSSPDRPGPAARRRWRRRRRSAGRKNDATMNTHMHQWPMLTTASTKQAVRIAHRDQVAPLPVRDVLVVAARRGGDPDRLRLLWPCPHRTSTGLYDHRADRRLDRGTRPTGRPTRGATMSNRSYRVTEVVGTSPDGIDQAIRNGDRASLAHPAPPRLVRGDPGPRPGQGRRPSSTSRSASSSASASRTTDRAPAVRFRVPVGSR